MNLSTQSQDIPSDKFTTGKVWKWQKTVLLKSLKRPSIRPVGYPLDRVTDNVNAFRRKLAFHAANQPADVNNPRAFNSQIS